MTFEIAILFALILAVLALFATETLPVDLVSLAIICVLVATGILTPAQAFAGFGSDVLIILACVFTLSGAVVRAGVIDWLGVALNRLSGRDDGRARAMLLGICAAASSVFSNTSATAVLMPAAVSLARRTRQSASRFLMPLAYASILGGTCTLIGTSTNLAGSGMAAQLGLEPFSIFEFVGIGAIITVVGVLWLSLFGDRFLAARAPAELVEQFAVREFLAVLTPAEATLDKTVGKSGLANLGVTPLVILRGKRNLPAHPLRKIAEGDRMLVKASPEALKKVQADGAFTLMPEEEMAETGKERDALSMAEAVITPQSRHVGQTLKSADFASVYDLVPLALYRRGQAYPMRLDNMRLRVGDVLLLQGEHEALDRLRGDPDVWGLVELGEAVLTPRQGLITLASLAGALLAGAIGLAPLSIAMLLAVIVVVMTGCIRMEDAYRFIEWRLLVLIAGMTSLGAAMVETGAADYLALAIVSASLPFGPTATLAAFAILTIALTQPMSNAAAALTVMPVAVAAAEPLAVDPRSLAILVTLSASLSFITPFEPASLLVYGPGKYRFIDFIRAGLPLTAIALVLIVWLVPILWPL